MYLCDTSLGALRCREFKGSFKEIQNEMITMEMWRALLRQPMYQYIFQLRDVSIEVVTCSSTALTGPQIQAYY